MSLLLTSDTIQLLHLDQMKLLARIYDVLPQVLQELMHAPLKDPALQQGDAIVVL